MRIVLFGLSIVGSLFISMTSEASILDQQTVIIEVDGDPHERGALVKEIDQQLDIIATYDTLLDGIALTGRRTSIEKVRALDFVQAIHPVTMYEAITWNESNSESVVPRDIHSSSYTGAGVKVGVVDTGIDYTHPDLAENYRGGYDVVDFDDDPMETPEDGGFGTIHGTHVAGIIAANGELQGVAPDAELYMYRALGPGGFGTSVQVIAAMEEAVKDGVDLLNLSLGNTINGPDFPTSIAVNKAEALGVLTVIANGNAGPDEWTIGSPATASQAFSVGAVDEAHEVATLYEPISETDISFTNMIGSPAWDLQTDYPVMELTSEDKAVRGGIVLAKRDEETFIDKAISAEEAGAVALLVYDEATDDLFQGSIQAGDTPITIPVASISRTDAQMLIDYEAAVYIQTIYSTIPARVAEFSSRGPVTMNWSIKPDIIAPGARINSTVPGGYDALQGTSMAAPHVTGGLAVLKEAHPDWTNDQLIAAIETTAKRLEHSDGTPFLPIEQGLGIMQIDEAIDAEVLLHGAKLSFGKVSGLKGRKTAVLTIENRSSEDKTFSFAVPPKEKGVQWTLPLPFTVAAQAKKEVAVTIDVMHVVDVGVHQGWLTIHEGGDVFDVAYLFVAEEADQPKAMGFTFHRDPFSEATYVYQLYVTEEVETFVVDLYDPETLRFEGTLLDLEVTEAGLQEGNVATEDVPFEGIYLAVIMIYLASGEIDEQLVEVSI